MDAAAVQAIVDAAVAAAMAVQANNMPAQPAPPAAAAFSLTPGVVNMQAPWDYSTSEGIKLFFQSTAAVKPLYDGTETSLKMFLKSIDAKAKTFGWDSSILRVDDDNGNPRDLIKHYGALTIDNVQAKAATYIGTDTRAAQSSAQLATCLGGSIVESTLMKLLLRASEYTVLGVEDGPCMLRTLISVVSVETRATIGTVRTALKNLPILMHEVDSDITEFNTKVGHYIDKLNANDYTCEDLLTHLFEGYQTATDEVFVKYIKDKEDRWEDGTIVTLEAAALMRLAEEKFKTMKLKKLWNGTTKEEANIIAMKAEVQEMTEIAALRAEVAALRNNDTDKKHSRNRNGGKKDTGEWEWKNVAPTGSQPKEKTFKNKVYIYCMFHGDTKWVLKSNHVGGCRNDPNHGAKEKVEESKKQAPPDKKTLQYAKALMNAMETQDEEI
jgi:hypothetical protein